MINPYEILGVHRDAPEAEIKAAYRKLVKQFHPDVNKGDHEAMIRHLNEAYDILSDPVRKAEYDRMSVGGFTFDYQGGPQEKYAHTVVEDDPVEAYKREYKARKIREARENAQRKAKLEAEIYKFIRVLLYPIAFFTSLVILDYFLPPRIELDTPLYGYQRTHRSKHSSDVISYIKTARYEFEVPDNLHLDYDYYAEKKLPLYIEFTPIFNSLKRIGVDYEKYAVVYNAPASIYSFLFFPIPYILLLLCVVFIRKKAYSKARYSLSFMPIVIALVLIVMMMSRP